MPDTSPVADVGGWQGAAIILVSGLGALAAGIGNILGKRAKDKEPFKAIPEVAGVSMTLIDGKVQAEILEDTKRTADCMERVAEGVERIERVILDALEDTKDERERQERRQEKQQLEERIREGDRDREHLKRLLEDARQSAGPYTVQPRQNP